MSTEGIDRQQQKINEFMRLLPLTTAIAGLPHGEVLPEFQALDRFSWLELNVGLMQRALEPLERAAIVPNSLLAQAGRAGLTRYTAWNKTPGQAEARPLGRAQYQREALWWNKSPPSRSGFCLDASSHTASTAWSY